MGPNFSLTNAQGAGAVPSPFGQVGAGKRILWLQPAGGTTISTFGGVITISGTVSTSVFPGTGNNLTRWRRTIVTGAAAINAGVSILTAYTAWSRSNTSGFDAQFHFGIESNATGHGAFVGMSTLVANMPTATPSTALVNCVGIGFDSTDANTGTWFLLYNDGSGSCTKTAIAGMTRSTSQSYVLRITCPQGAASNITVSVINATTKESILAPTVLTTNLPVANTTLAPGVHMRTDGVLTTAPVISAASIYVAAND